MNHSILPSISEIEIDQDCLSSLELLVSAVAPYSFSTLLVGSRPEGIASIDSDIDIVIITSDESSRETCIKKFENACQQVMKDFPEIDAKILTIDNLMKLWGTHHHFCIWSYIHKGMLVAGEDLRNRFQLNAGGLRRTVIFILDMIENVSENIQTKNETLQDIFSLLDVAKTIIFLEKHITRQLPLNTKDELRGLLGSNFDTIMKQYSMLKERRIGRYDVGRESRYGQSTMKKLSKRISHTELRNTADEVLKRVNNGYRDVIKHIEKYDM